MLRQKLIEPDDPPFGPRYGARGEHGIGKSVKAATASAEMHSTPVFAASSAFNQQSKVVLLQSEAVHFDLVKSEQSRPVPRLQLRLLPTALQCVDAATHKCVFTISLWELMPAIQVTRQGLSLELVVLKAPSTARQICCGPQTPHLKRHTYRLDVIPRGTDGAAEAKHMVQFWSIILQHAALGSLPVPSAGLLSAKRAHDGPVSGMYANLYSSHGQPRIAAPPARRLLVFINPAAGPGRAVERFDDEARPVLEDAGCCLDVIVLDRPGRSTDEARDMPWPKLREYHGVLSVGGDGSLSEVVNGLMARPDWRRAVDHLALGVMPAGSGNGLSISLLTAAGLPCTMTHAAFMVAKGVVCRMDVASTFVQREEPGPGEAPPITHAKGWIAHHSQSAALTPLASPTSPAHSAVGTVEAFPSPSPSPATSSQVATQMSLRSLNTAANALADRIVEQRWGHRRWQFLSTEWAIVADIDLESESMRWLGASRFDVYGAIRGVNLRRYRGRFCYLPDDKSMRSGRKWTQGMERLNNNEPEEEDVTAVPRVATGSPTTGLAGGGSAPRLSSAVPAATSIVSDAGEDAFPAVSTGRDSANSTEVCSDPLPELAHLPPFESPVPLSWRTVEGTFTFLWITNTSHQSAGVAVSPDTHHSDGAMAVTLVRDSDPVTMMKVLLALDGKGSLHGIAGVEHFTCLAWRLEPEHRGKALPEGLAACPDPRVRAGHGHVAIDGEPVPYGPVQAEVHPGLLKVYGPGAPVEHAV